MAESYIITIKFAPSDGSLKQTEKKLNGVFDRVTHRFKTLFQKAWSSIKWGAGIGFAATAITALLGRFGQVNDQVNGLLSKASNLKDRAQGAGSDIASYGFVSGYARSKGVNPEMFDALLSRMQTMVGAAKNGERNALWEYRGETDMAKVFYNVMNQIAKVSQVDKARGAALASSVFGQRAVTQLGPLVSEGFGDQELLKTLQKVDWGKYQQTVLEKDELGSKQARLAFLRETDDFFAKARLTTEKTIAEQDKYLRNQNDKDNSFYGNYDKMSKIQETADKLEKAITDFSLTFLPILTTAAGGLEELVSVVKDAKDDPTPHLKTLAGYILKAMGPFGFSTRAALHFWQGKNK